MPAIRLDEQQLLSLRARAQRLVAPGWPAGAGAPEILSAVVGTQAQEAPSGALGLRVRGLGSGITQAAIDHARLVDRSILRGWFMRGTLHFVTAEDARWLLPLMAPVILPGVRRRMQQLGWDTDSAAIGLRLLRDTIAARGPLSRPQIAALMADHHLPATGQAPLHLIFNAMLAGDIVQGPDAGKQPTFALREDWLGPLDPLPREEALLRLARRYLNGHAPAAPADFANWCGLPVGPLRAAWQRLLPDLVEVETPAGAMWLLKDQRGWLDDLTGGPGPARLLPRFDNYLFGYRSRALSLPQAFEKRIFPGGGYLYAAVQVDGRLVGAWQLHKQRAGITITVEPFDPLEPAASADVDAEIADLGRFLGVAAQRGE